MIGTDKFIEKGKEAVLLMAVDGLDPTDNTKLTLDDIYFVTCAFVLNNIKGLFSTSLPDGKYYEVTYDNTKKKMYVDCYVRTHQMTVDMTNTE